MVIASFLCYVYLLHLHHCLPRICGKTVASSFAIFLGLLCQNTQIKIRKFKVLNIVVEVQVSAVQTGTTFTYKPGLSQ